MARGWGGQTYDEDWFPIDAQGNRLGDKDYAANAAYAAANQTQNPYTNEKGASAYDKSGLIPGNQPGSTLPAVNGTASQTPAYRQGANNGWSSISQLASMGNTAQAPASNPTVGFEPWLTPQQPSQGSASGASAMPMEQIIQQVIQSQPSSETRRRSLIQEQPQEETQGDDPLSVLWALLENGVQL